MPAYWYVLKTKPRAEALVANLLSHWGVPHFAPLITTLKGRKESKEYLFPGYMFFRLEPGSRLWPMVRWMQGVNHIVTAEGVPIPVDDAVVAEVRRRTEEWNAGAYRRVFRRGEVAQITQGPLAGLEAVFQGYLPGQQRCEALLRFLDHQFKTVISSGDLRHIAPEEPPEA